MRSKFFINYEKFKHALLLIAIMAILLVFHVVLIFLDYPIFIQFHVQQVLGLFLAITLTLFAYRLFSVVR
jgi:predicted ferric reductase